MQLNSNIRFIQIVFRRRLSVLSWVNTKIKHFVAALKLVRILESHLSKTRKKSGHNINWLERTHVVPVSNRKIAKETREIKIQSQKDSRVYHEYYFFANGALEAWCEQYCAGEWAFVYNERERIFFYYFKNQKDALAFRMVWT